MLTRQEESLAYLVHQVSGMPSRRCVVGCWGASLTLYFMLCNDFGLLEDERFGVDAVDSGFDSRDKGRGLVAWIY